MYVPAAVRKCSMCMFLAKSLICIRPVIGLLFAVALLGIRTRRCLISDLIYDDHLGSQTLGAPSFRSMQVRFTNIVVALVQSDCSRYLIFLPIKIPSRMEDAPCDPCQLIGKCDTNFVVWHPR